MGSIALSIENQIKKLVSRGMLIDIPNNKLEEILLDIGYYRLGFYWHPFEKDKLHNFKNGTKFSTIIDLYYLDVNLRNLLIKYLSRIELNFRTKLIYYTSLYYVDNPTWYTNNLIMTEEYLKDLNAHYNKNFKSKNIQICKHHENHPADKYAPCWKTFEYYTFGSIVKTYQHLINEKIKKEISIQYGLKKSYKLQNILDSFVFVRNSCAHSGVIFDLHIDEGLTEPPGIKFSNEYSHNLDAAFKCISFLLESISRSRCEEFNESLKNLFDRYITNSTIKDIVENKIGYTYS